MWDAVNECFDVMPIAATVDDRVRVLLLRSLLLHLSSQSVDCGCYKLYLCVCLCVCLALAAYCSKTNKLILMHFLLLNLVLGPIDYVKIW